jgi:hypothetical protein
MTPAAIKCPFCETVDDWHERHEHSFSCGSCDAIRHRFDERSDWEFVSPRKLRAGRAADSKVRDVFDTAD